MRNRIVLIPDTETDIEDLDSFLCSAPSDPSLHIAGVACRGSRITEMSIGWRPLPNLLWAGLRQLIGKDFDVTTWWNRRKAAALHVQSKRSEGKTVR